MKIKKILTPGAWRTCAFWLIFSPFLGAFCRFDDRIIRGCLTLEKSVRFAPGVALLSSKTFVWVVLVGRLRQPTTHTKVQCIIQGTCGSPRSSSVGRCALPYTHASTYTPPSAVQYSAEQCSAMQCSQKGDVRRGGRIGTRACTAWKSEHADLDTYGGRIGTPASAGRACEPLCCMTVRGMAC